MIKDARYMFNNIYADLPEVKFSGDFHSKGHSTQPTKKQKAKRAASKRARQARKKQR